MTKPFYHFDHVGSYLRPERLKNANSEDLTKIRQEEIAKLVKKQAEVGLAAVTDGEFNRSWWHLDFLWGLNGVEAYSQENSYKFHGEKTRTTNVRLTGKIAFNPEHSFFADFEYLKSVLPENVQAKVTIPSPTMFFRDNRSDNWSKFYETWEEYLTDLAQTYHETLQHYYDLGARYVQLDDTTWAFLIAQLTQEIDLEKNQKSAEDAVFVINKALENLPADLRVTAHICRGNFKSTYLFEGSYAPVAKYLGQLNYDSFFLEYDDDRSGDFAPLAEIWNNRENVGIVLGIFTSKYPELESEDNIKARLDEALQYVPLENLALSTQCGFASTEEGNKLTEDEEWNKLRHIKQIADKIWN